MLHDCYIGATLRNIFGFDRLGGRGRGASALLPQGRRLAVHVGRRAVGSPA